MEVERCWICGCRQVSCSVWSKVLTLAAPKITTLDKREAKISQGESILVPDDLPPGDSKRPLWMRNLELNVTPQITSRDPKETGKLIMMKVPRNQKRSRCTKQSGWSGQGIIDRREATTQVMIRDGETMGDRRGLYRYAEQHPCLVSPLSLARACFGMAL